MSIQAYQTETGESRWKVYVNIRGKESPNLRAQRRLSGLKTQREAEREEIRLIRECQREILEKESQGANWGSLVEAYDENLRRQVLEGHIHSTTQADNIASMRIHTASWWERPSTSLTRSDAREVLNQMKAQGYSLSHQRRIKGIVNQVFVFGQDNRFIPATAQSPTVGIDLKRDEEKKPEILNLGEIRRLLEAAQAMNDSWYSIWSMALLTGMRSGELYALEWSDVDLENKTISVNKSYNGRMHMIKCTKAGYCRNVPISSELRELLLGLQAESKEQGRKFVLPRLRKWTKGMAAHELRRFCSGLGVPSVRFHALRACFATQLIRSGVPPIQIQKICGWRDLKTMQRYIRLAGIEIDGATEVLRVLPDSQVADRAGKLFAGFGLEMAQATA